MNLHEYSQQHNDEMGILVSRKEDRQLYDDIFEDADRIVEESKEIPIPVPVTGAWSKVAKDGKQSPPKKNFQNGSGTPKDGFCIRCKATLPANPDRPYCKRCYATWKRYRDEELKEKYCHTCGSEYVATLREPVCRACRQERG